MRPQHMRVLTPRARTSSHGAFTNSSRRGFRRCKNVTPSTFWGGVEVQGLIAIEAAQHALSRFLLRSNALRRRRTPRVSVPRPEKKSFEKGRVPKGPQHCLVVIGLKHQVTSRSSSRPSSAVFAAVAYLRKDEGFAPLPCETLESSLHGKPAPHHAMK